MLAALVIVGITLALGGALVKIGRAL